MTKVNSWVAIGLCIKRLSNHRKTMFLVILYTRPQNVSIAILCYENCEASKNMTEICDLLLDNILMMFLRNDDSDPEYSYQKCIRKRDSKARNCSMKHLMVA